MHVLEGKLPPPSWHFDQSSMQTPNGRSRKNAQGMRETQHGSDVRGSAPSHESCMPYAFTILPNWSVCELVIAERVFSHMVGRRRLWFPMIMMVIIFMMIFHHPGSESYSCLFFLLVFPFYGYLFFFFSLCLSLSLSLWLRRYNE